jgi:predicted nucleotidyltransferase
MFVLNRETINKAIRTSGLRNISETAKKIGVHRNSLGRYISGQEPVLPESISRLLEFLRLDAGAAIIHRASPCLISEADPVAALVDELVVAFPEAAYVLFGSRARKDSRRYSDFDLGVYSKNGIKLEKYLWLLEFKERFEEKSPYFVDFVNLNNATADFLKSILPDLQFLGGRHSDWMALRNNAAGTVSGAKTSHD